MMSILIILTNASVILKFLSSSRLCEIFFEVLWSLFFKHAASQVRCDHHYCSDVVVCMETVVVIGRYLNTEGEGKYAHSKLLSCGD